MILGHCSSRHVWMVVLLAVLFSPAVSASPDDWPVWRGPNGNGTAEKGPTPPVTWTDSKNIVWKVSIPGRGHASPIIIKDRIFLPTADETVKSQSLLCLDKATGKLLWTTQLNRGGLPKKIHKKNTHASGTAASDGERVFVSFFNRERIQLAALDFAGKILWQKTVHPFKPKKYEYGYSASPLLYKSLVIIVGDCDSGGFLSAFDQSTGRQKWQVKRPSNLSWSSPIIGHVAGRDQLLISGNDLVSSYDPGSGRPLWSTRATTRATAGTVVWDDQRVFASGGYPKAGTYGLQGDGSKRVLWQNNTRCYEQSMLVVGEHLYAVDDRGVAHCWIAKDGTERWRSDLGGKVSASPTLSGSTIYLPNETGTLFVFRADPSKFTLLGKNKLGNDMFASPVIVGGRIYLRVGHGYEGNRKEILYCIGKTR